MQRDGGVDAFHDEHVERAAHASDGLGPIASISDQLRDQRIVERRNHVVGVGRGVDADADVSRQIQRGDAAGRRRERLGIFGVDAALDGVALDRRPAAE